jgi:hypothetical protein
MNNFVVEIWKSLIWIQIFKFIQIMPNYHVGIIKPSLSTLPTFPAYLTYLTYLIYLTYLTYFPNLFKTPDTVHCAGWNK